MAGKDYGSLTKEPPLKNLDDTVLAARPGMNYSDLLKYARQHTHKDAPGLVRKRFIKVTDSDVVSYDRFLSLVAAHGISSPFVRKAMLFVWAYRDERVRRFLCECIADKQGKWRARELVNKANFEFFVSNDWLEERAARKARSNIEFFLVEAQLFDLATKRADLQLDDGWLFEAAAVAAQHEDDLRTRKQLLDDPCRFLVDRNWQGMIDATPEELFAGGVSPPEDVVPLEDDAIDGRTIQLRSGKIWDRRKPRQSDKKSTSVFIDLVARERANQSHFQLEELVAQGIRRIGAEPKYTAHIDMYFTANEETVLVEMKSCDSGNIHSQIRKGVSQLFEYRYMYSSLLGRDPKLLLIVETEPMGAKSWLADYLQSLGITLAWRDHSGQSLVSMSKPLKTFKKLLTYRS